MPKKRRPTKFDKALSLQIDRLHAAIDAARRAGLGRKVAGLTARLRELERRIPK